MLILYFHKTYYPGPEMAIPVGITSCPHERRAGPGRHRTKEDMSPPKPLKDNAIGWAPMTLRITALGRVTLTAAEMRSSAISATGSSGFRCACAETMDGPEPTLEDVRAGK